MKRLKGKVNWSREIREYIVRRTREIETRKPLEVTMIINERENRESN